MSIKLEENTVVLMCGGRKCCPAITFKNDGSAVLRDQDDGRDEEIHLSAGQLVALKNALNDHSKG